jgi:hypothetical protein
MTSIRSRSRPNNTRQTFIIRQMVDFTPRLSVPHSLTVKPPASANILPRVARCPQEWIHTPLNNLKRHIQSSSPARSRPTRAAQSLCQRTRLLSFTDIPTSSPNTLAFINTAHGRGLTWVLAIVDKFVSQHVIHDGTLWSGDRGDGAGRRECH